MSNCIDCKYFDTCKLVDIIKFCKDCKYFHDCDILSTCEGGEYIECDNGFESMDEEED